MDGMCVDAYAVIDVAVQEARRWAGKPQRFKEFSEHFQGGVDNGHVLKIKPLTKRLKVFSNIPGHPGQC